MGGDGSGRDGMGPERRDGREKERRGSREGEGKEGSNSHPLEKILDPPLRCTPPNVSHISFYQTLEFRLSIYGYI